MSVCVWIHFELFDHCPFHILYDNLSSLPVYINHVLSQLGWAIQKEVKRSNRRQSIQGSAGIQLAYTHSISTTCLKRNVYAGISRIRWGRINGSPITTKQPSSPHTTIR